MGFANNASVTGSNGNSVNAIYGAAVNNALLDPLQGYDADVWALDQSTGNYLLVGRFTSIQVTIRNATEPYMEFNQRVPRYLDGEIQIGWVLERGQIDSRILQQTFGVSALTRELRLNRMPRLQITFEMNAHELDTVNAGGATGPDYQSDQGIIGNGGLLLGNGPAGYDQRRKASGQLMLTFCKVDSLTIGAMAGRSVIANRWEGLAEGIEEVDRTAVWAGVTLKAASASNALRTANLGVGSQDGNLSRPPGIF